MGLAGAVSTSKFGWSNVYYVGPEKNDTNDGRRHLWDSVLTLTPHPKASFYVNFDYLAEKRLGRGYDRVVGIGGAGKFELLPWFAIAPRLEWLNDASGFSTGVAQKIKEFTITSEFKMKEGVLTRLEYRRDWSNQPFFNRGNQSGNWKNQDTVLLGVVAYFGGEK